MIHNGTEVIFRGDMPDISQIFTRRLVKYWNGALGNYGISVPGDMQNFTGCGPEQPD